MHLSPYQAADGDVSRCCTCLLSALAKCQNIHVNDIANGGNGGVKGVAEVNKVSSLKKKQDVRQGRPLRHAGKGQKQRRKKVREIKGSGVVIEK
jgi:hypothetical protein